MSVLEWIQTWATELWTFILSFRRHVVLLVTSSTLAAIGVFYKFPIEEYLGWILGLLIFWGSFLSWREQYKKVLSAERRRHICDELARYAERGEILLAQCLNEAIPDDVLNTSFSAWVNETKSYLTANLGKSYAILFDSFIGEHLPPRVQTTTIRQNVWILTWHRVYRLSNFMKEYQAPYLGN